MRNRDWICHDIDPGRTLALFNFDFDQLTDEPITDADIVPVKITKDSQEACGAWSAGCGWYFVNTAAGIILARPGDSIGRLCVKRSWRFIEAYLEAPKFFKSKGKRK